MGSLGRWVIFLTIFLCIYGSLHLYMLIKVRRALYLEGLGYILLVVVLAFLMLAPIEARLLEPQGYPGLSLALSWIGYLWMGYIFLFVCLAIPVDTYHLVINGFRQMLDVDWTHLLLSRRQSLSLITIVSLVLMAYGAVAAYRVRVQKVVLHSAKIPPTVARVRIAQITDLHLGLMVYPGRLAPILATLREVQPDILVSTGDLIDGPVHDEPEAAQTLNALPAPMGKFAVTGNHEYYAGLEYAENFIRAAGFQLIDGRSVTLKDRIVIAGVGDRQGQEKGALTETELAAKLPKDKFVVLLKHRPLVADAADPRFDLQLSGHTHGGQIFPFSLLIKLFYSASEGLSRIGPDRHLYLSRGTGTWGPPLRVLAPPEIAVFDLLPAETAKEIAPGKKTIGKDGQ